ncbi:MAG: hypothetical protein HY291_02945 [Planctomycetes bacterium]|nr:hypothetical protein [Planctomycetota bacterium]
MRTLMSLLVLLALVTAVPALRAEDVKAPEKAADPVARIQKALGMRLEKLDDKEHSLTELLSLFGQITKENFVLDPTLPKTVADTKVKIQVQAGGTVLDAFSVALALSGLRYTVMDGAVFISTEGKLSDKLLSGQGAADPVAIGQARQPVTVGDAVVRSQPFDPYQDNFVQPRDFIGYYPWRLWEPERYNAKTGLTDFPGPPVDIDSPQVGHPRFRYTSTPYFLKPEFLAYEQEKREYRDEQDRQDSAERQASARALSVLLQFLKDNPDMKAEDILKKLGKSK